MTILIFLICVSLSSRIVTVFSENAPVQRSCRVIIDPGHGGIDGGAVSCTGVPESRYNLEIALCLEDLLHLTGFETLMTRREDISIYTQGNTIAQKKISDLKERLRITNETPDAILLSIHQNHFSDHRYSGAQVFYPNTPGSAEFAVQMQTALCTSLDPENHRQAKKCRGIYLMDKVQCTALLIECGFLSNPREEALLSSQSYQQKLCAVIAASLADYLSNT